MCEVSSQSDLENTIFICRKDLSMVFYMMNAIHCVQIYRGGRSKYQRDRLVDVEFYGMFF